MTDQLGSQPAFVSPKFILRYCIFLFAASWAPQIAGILSTDTINDPSMVGWLVCTMLTPTIITLIFMARYPALRMLLLWKPNRQLFLTTILAVLVPILFALTSVAAILLLGWGRSTWFAFSVDGVTISGGPFFFGVGHQSWWLFGLNLFVTGLAFAMLNSVFAAGEELAWRGLLQGLLTNYFGKWKGILLLGFIWSMWHLPIQLAGYNYPQNPIAGSFILSPLILIGYSFFMGWLTLRSQSFIPAAVAHGAINGIQEGILVHIDLNVPELYLYLVRTFVSVVIGLVFLLIWDPANPSNERVTA